MECGRKQSSNVGETAISAMLESLNRDQKHAAIARLIQNELFTERESSLASPARLLTDRACERTRCSIDRAVETVGI